MGKQDDWQDSSNIGDPADITFSDDEQSSNKVSGETEELGQARYFEEEKEEDDTEEGGWVENNDAPPVVGKPPFYSRPIFFLVVFMVVVLAGSLMLSLSKQKKRKAVQFGGEQQQFSQAPPQPPGDIPQPLPMDARQQPQPGTFPEAAVVAENATATAPVAVDGGDAPGAASLSPQPTATPSPGQSGAIGAPQQAAPGAATSGGADLIALENRMKEEILALSAKNLALQREVRQLTARVDRMTKTGGGAAATASVPKKTTETAPAAPAASAPVNPISALSIKAIRKGQAWISSPTGTYTVNVGDMLPGNIRVTGIDPDNLEVSTSGGIIRYNK